MRPADARQPPTDFRLPASSSQLGEKPLISMRIVWEMYENCMRITSNWCSPTTNWLPASSFQLPIGRETVSVYVLLKEKQSIRVFECLKLFIIIWKVFLLFCHVYARVLWEMYEKFVFCMRNGCPVNSSIIFVWETQGRFFLYEKPLAGESLPQILARHNNTRVCVP